MLIDTRAYIFVSIAKVFHVSFFSSQEVIILKWKSGKTGI